MEDYRLENQEPGAQGVDDLGWQRGEGAFPGGGHVGSGIPPLHLPATETSTSLGLGFLIRKMGTLVFRIIFFF